MPKTLKEIAAFVSGEVSGDGSVIISGVAGIQEAGAGELTFLANPRYTHFLAKTNASAVIVSKDTVVPEGKTAIRADNPSLAFTKAVSFILPRPEHNFKGIHKSAVVAKSAKIGRNAAIGACVVIDEGASVGDNAVIYPHCYLGRNCSVGRDALLYSNVSIREECRIGDRVILNCGVVVGSDGFGFITVDGAQQKIPQVGIVVVEDDVEIGANTTIDRARFDKTLIGAGTKIDNLVQIAHNVHIGKNCLIVALTGIAGSAVIGDNVIIAAQVGMVGHITIGDNSVIMARTGVNKSLPAGSVVWGTPAKPAEEALKISACVQNLPRMTDSLRELKKKIEELEKKNG